MSSSRPPYKQIHKKGNKRPVLIAGARSAFVKSFGVFENCDSLELYSRVVEGLVRKSKIDPFEIDEISCGVVVPQTKNANVARDTAINIALPHHVHGYTLNRACTSSLQTIADAARQIAFGSPSIVLAGGVECLSDVPIVYTKEARRFLVKLSKARSTAEKINMLTRFHLSDFFPRQPNLSEPLTGLTMGESCEIMAKINDVQRLEQDKFALASHQKAAAAQEKGYFNDEIVPIWPSPKFDLCVDKDNIIRKDTNLESLAKLRPAFDKKFGTITAGNSSPLTDGAACSLIADEERAKSLGLTPKALIRDFTFVGVDPRDQLLIGPAIAIPLLLKKNNLQISDIDIFEIHEAFAAQVLSCLKSMDSPSFNDKYFGENKSYGLIPEDKININGGAIAIGHPFGATGSRLVNTMSAELQRQNKTLGVIAVCAAGGMACAMLIERLN